MMMKNKNVYLNVKIMKLEMKNLNNVFIVDKIYKLKGINVGVLWDLNIKLKLYNVQNNLLK